MKLTASDSVDWGTLNIGWLTIAYGLATFSISLILVLFHLLNLKATLSKSFFHIFKWGSTQTRKVIKQVKWEWTVRQQDEICVPCLPFTGVISIFLWPASESASKFLHPNSWDLATQGSGSGGRAYETPLYPGSSPPHLCFLFIPLLFNPRLIPFLLPPSEGLAERKDLLTWVFTSNNYQQTESHCSNSGISAVVACF